MTRQALSRSITIAVCLSVLPLSAAAVATPTPTPTPTPSAATSQRLTNLKTKGAAEIDRRLTNLTAAFEKLAKARKISAADKGALAKQIQDESTGLTSLKTKLANETTLAGARADVASIVTDYRVYVLMLPKTRLVAATDAAAVSVSNLNDLAAKLTSHISAAKSNNKDVSALETKLDDMKAKTADAGDKIDGLVAKLLAVQPSDYNTSHAVLGTYRQILAAVVTDITAARADAKSIIDGLKQL
ncbi:MAG TPA: hypothetical protein VI322_03320 [Candidatus Saccharimonadia bacterium]